MRVRPTILGAALASALATAGAQTSAIDRAAWLAGCWELRAGSRATLEMWMPPTADVMLGASRTVVNGRTTAHEYLRIRASGDTLVYTAIPSNQRETDFRAVGGAPSPLVFENRAHDFPQAIIYRRVSADSIVARIEGPGPNNTTRGIDFRMRRVSCTEPLPAPVPGPADTVVMDAEYSRDPVLVAIVKGTAPNWDVYVMSADGRISRRLTDNPTVDYQPSWSPDGGRIAFVSARDGHQEIYTIRRDGSELAQLTRGSAHNSEPAWSPDGRSIAFRSERDGRGHIYLMNADGSAQRALTRDSAGGTSPAWSPDGARIAFGSNRTGRSEVYVMGGDGTGQRQLTTSPQGHSGLPGWSPDGARIAFWSSRDGNDEVYVMNADGSGARNLSTNAARDVPLGWTPDGAYIVFRSNRDRAMYDIYRMKPDGTDVTRVTITR